MSKSTLEIYLNKQINMQDYFTTDTGTSSKVCIFISYSNKDEELKNDLLMQLKVLTISDKQLEIWEDGLLEPGINWDEEIKDKLHAAHIVLMLVSARFLTTNYIWNIEVQDTLLRQQKNEVTAIPVILSPCAWTQTPLAKFQALPKKGRPVTEFADKDTALLEVVNGISRVISIWKNNLNQ